MPRHRPRTLFPDLVPRAISGAGSAGEGFLHALPGRPVLPGIRVEHAPDARGVGRYDRRRAHSETDTRPARINARDGGLVQGFVRAGAVPFGVSFGPNVPGDCSSLLSRRMTRRGC